MGYIRGLLSCCVGSTFKVTTSYVGMISGVQKRALNNEESNGKEHGKSMNTLGLLKTPWGWLFGT